jgi:hypothetical protein
MKHASLSVFLRGLAILLAPSAVWGQGFLREGFSSQLDTDFQSETKLEENDAMLGMTREMFLMQELKWELSPIEWKRLRPDLVAPSDGDSRVDGATRAHIRKYLQNQGSVSLQLLKRRGRFGLRAVAVTQKGQKLRAFWREQPKPMGVASSRNTRATDFLTMSYDDALRSRLFNVEFEVQLPKIKKFAAWIKRSRNAPSVIYSVALEPGTMNPKIMIPRGVADVAVLAEGRQANDSGVVSKAARTSIVGTAVIGSTPLRPGLVDPTWARWRGGPFRKGRPTGLI